MPLLLYKVKKAYRWYRERVSVFLENNDVPADSVCDMQTTDNFLSVWEVDQNKADVIRIVRAIAIGCEKIDDAGYILLDSDYLNPTEIQVRITEGTTLDKNINSRHRDLVLSGKKLITLTSLFLRYGELNQVTKGELREAVLKGIENGEIPESCRKKVAKVA